MVTRTVTRKPSKKTRKPRKTMTLTVPLAETFRYNKCRPSSRLIDHQTNHLQMLNFSS